MAAASVVVVRAVSLARVPQMAWLMSQAYARSRPLAVLAWVTAFGSLVPYAVRGGLYWSWDRDGMVVIAPWRPWLDTILSVVTLVVIAAPIGIAGAIISDLTGMPGQILIVAIAVVIGSGAAVLSSGELSGFPIGAETPPGERWQVAALAQRPGTRNSALALTREVINITLPPGSVVTAVARNEKLRESYIRLGFHAGKKGRLWLIKPPGPLWRAAS